MSKNPNPNNPHLSRRSLLAGAGAGLATAGLAGAGTAEAAHHEGGKGKQLAGRTAFITGGARGIGLAIGKKLASEGANIALYDIAKNMSEVRYPLASNQDLARARAEIQSAGVQCLTFGGDVRDKNRMARAMEQTKSRFGKLDILIVNAGITQIGPVENATDKDVAAILDINLGGAIKTVQAAVPLMKDQGWGRMIFIASSTARQGNATFPIYGASKWGVVGLAKNMALALGKSNITCNAICPSVVNTKLVDNDYILGAMTAQNPSLPPTMGSVEAFMRQINVLPGGMIEPVQVAEIASFICSPACDIISGEVYDIALGRNANSLA